MINKLKVFLSKKLIKNSNSSFLQKKSINFYFNESIDKNFTVVNLFNTKVFYFDIVKSDNSENYTLNIVLDNEKTYLAEFDSYEKADRSIHLLKWDIFSGYLKLFKKTLIIAFYILLLNIILDMVIMGGSKIIVKTAEVNNSSISKGVSEKELEVAKSLAMEIIREKELQSTPQVPPTASNPQPEQQVTEPQSQTDQYLNLLKK